MPRQKQNALLTLKDFETKLNRGGMPGLCFIRDDLEFSSSCDMWIETTCYRDLQQIRAGRLEGSLGHTLLSEIARQHEPTLASLGRALKKVARIIARYIQAFEAILVVQRLEPHPAGVGKAIYSLCDVGLASHLGAQRESLIRTHLLFEALTLFESQGLGRPMTYYYRNAKTSRVPLIFDWQNKKGAPANIALHYVDSESLSPSDYSALLALAKRTDWSGRLLLLIQTKTSFVEGNIEVSSLRG